MNEGNVSDKTAPDFTRHKNTADRAIAIATDLAGIVGLGGVASQAIKEAIDRRRSQARESLVEAIAEGRADFEVAAIEQIDEFAGIAIRYMRAAEEGTRARNLRLLAIIFARQVSFRKANSEDFAKKAAAVEGLTDDEMQLFGLWLATDPHATLHQVREKLGFSDDQYLSLSTTAAAMMRLGLVEPLSAWGGMGYKLTPIAIRVLDELKPADFAGG